MSVWVPRLKKKMCDLHKKHRQRDKQTEKVKPEDHLAFYIYSGPKLHNKILYQSEAARTFCICS